MSFIEATLTASLATPQSAAVIAGCDRTSEDKRMRSLIHCLPTSPVMLATFQSAAVTAGCDSLRNSYASRAWQDEGVRSLFHCPPALEQQLQSMQVYGGG
ncbi:MULTISPECIES: hypothetical protein [Cyanophyceae]|uniref:hypothetical protein n=1 Tax=Cyanophyceae TaxID=3028117 RepID=UPI001689B736|nr:hypothetical protein [Trichocoleus sp. FACHB-40]MBD2003601.1 hypothetical protein [Trichocoleus sp. FACHB-40]